MKAVEEGKLQREQHIHMLFFLYFDNITIKFNLHHRRTASRTRGMLVHRNRFAKLAVDAYGHPMRYQGGFLCCQTQAFTKFRVCIFNLTLFCILLCRYLVTYTYIRMFRFSTCFCTFHIVPYIYIFANRILWELETVIFFCFPFILLLLCIQMQKTCSNFACSFESFCN